MQESRNAKRLPPYGRVVQAYQDESIQLDNHIYIFFGQQAKLLAYQQKKMGVLCMYLPYQDHADKYHWPISNQKVILLHTGGLTVAEALQICFELLSYLPLLIWLQYDNPDQRYTPHDQESPNDIFYPSEQLAINH